MVQFIAFRYRDLKEDRDVAHLIASVKPFQFLGPEYEMHFWPIDFLHFGRANSKEYHSCCFLMYMKKSFFYI